MNTQPRYLGIAVARALVTGDADRARTIANGRTAWRVCEARAILGAGRHIARVYGAPASIGRSVMGWTDEASPPAALAHLDERGAERPAQSD